MQNARRREAAGAGNKRRKVPQRDSELTGVGKLLAERMKNKRQERQRGRRSSGNVAKEANVQPAEVVPFLSNAGTNGI